MPANTKPEAATQLLGKDVGAWVRRHRADDRSWAWISRRLTRETDGAVVLSGEWLRQLYAEKPERVG